MLQDTLGQLWSKLEQRYDAADDCGCGCDSEAPPEAKAVIENSTLTESELVSYFKGELPFDQLLARVDADLDGETVTDLESLAETLERSDSVNARTATGD